MEEYLPELLYAFAYCLGLTVIAELIFAAICRVWDRQDLLLVVLVNVVTNPWVVFLFALSAEFDWEDYALLPLEIAAVVTEAVFYRRYSATIRHPWLFATGANLFSVGVGYVVALL